MDCFSKLSQLALYIVRRGTGGIVVPVDRPYRRTCRQFVDGDYTEGGRSGYIRHPKFAQSPEQYVRGFLILLKDLKDLFDYVEPADKNLACYSYRIHALLLRACVEVEANCKAILKENGYSRSGDWNMGDYRKIEKTHFLSAYEVKVPNWSGTKSTWSSKTTADCLPTESGWLRSSRRSNPLTADPYPTSATSASTTAIKASRS